MSRRWYRRVLSDILSVGLNLLFKTPNNVAGRTRCVTDLFQACRIHGSAVEVLDWTCLVDD